MICLPVKNNLSSFHSHFVLAFSFFVRKKNLLLLEVDFTLSFGPLWFCHCDKQYSKASQNHVLNQRHKHRVECSNGPKPTMNQSRKLIGFGIFGRNML